VPIAEVEATRPCSGRPQRAGCGARAADRFDDLADCVDHELRLLLVYLVAAICVGDVFVSVIGEVKGRGGGVLRHQTPTYRLGLLPSACTATQCQLLIR